MFTQGDRYMMALCIFVLLALASFSRNADWQSPRTLWESASRLAPLHARPRLNIAHLDLQAFDFESAEKQYREVLRLTLSNRTALYQSNARNAALLNLGLILVNKGDVRTGAKYIDMVAREWPDLEIVKVSQEFVRMATNPQ